MVLEWPVWNSLFALLNIYNFWKAFFVDNSPALSWSLKLSDLRWIAVCAVAGTGWVDLDANSIWTLFGCLFMDTFYFIDWVDIGIHEGFWISPVEISYLLLIYIRYLVLRLERGDFSKRYLMRLFTDDHRFLDLPTFLARDPFLTNIILLPANHVLVIVKTWLRLWPRGYTYHTFGVKVVVRYHRFIKYVIVN
jgi:hypothetical protein